MFRIVVFVLCMGLFVGLAAGEPGSLQVMSFNIRYGTAADGDNVWQHRRDLVVATIEKYAPDVLGTQECLDFQADYLDEQLRDYTHMGIGRDPLGQGEMVTIFYRPRRLTPIKNGTFWLSETPEEPGSISWGAQYPRIVSWVQFYDQELKTHWLYFNTHFSHVSEEARQNSAKLLAERAQKMDSVSFRIITGDFNAPAENSLPWETFHAADFRDAWRMAKEKIGPAHTGSKFQAPEPDLNYRIDWILYQGPLNVELCETVTHNDHGRYPSDHFPVVATFTYRENDINQ